MTEPTPLPRWNDEYINLNPDQQLEFWVSAKLYFGCDPGKPHGSVSVFTTVPFHKENTMTPFNTDDKRAFMQMYITSYMGSPGLTLARDFRDAHGRAEEAWDKAVAAGLIEPKFHTPSEQDLQADLVILADRITHAVDYAIREKRLLNIQRMGRPHSRNHLQQTTRSWPGSASMNNKLEPLHTSPYKRTWHIHWLRDASFWFHVSGTYGAYCRQTRHYWAGIPRLINIRITISWA